MAVIQISKIQVRRGKKNSDIGVPQLSSAEFAWAVDTQELFIGNGSITEGAPYVGNTKILTEHDSILELASSYAFGSAETITQSIPRSLQGKIDEIEVSVIDFGADPSGETDSRAAFETAFSELFNNVDPKFKKILKVPNGTYEFASDLHIPTGAYICGENPSQTILSIGNNSIHYVSDQGTEKGNFSSSDRPHDITIENITIYHLNGQTDISGAEDCTFTNVRWTSNYTLSSASVFVPENAHATYVIPSVSTGGNVIFAGPGVSTTITTSFITTFTITLNTAINSLNADPVFTADFIASISGSGIKVTSRSAEAVASSVSAEFTVTSLPTNDGTSITILPTLTEFNDGSGFVFASVHWDNNLFGTSVNDVTFDNCRFAFTPVGIECVQSDVFATQIYFRDCSFFECDTGIYISGVTRQENNWRIDDCKFEEIANQAFKSTAGRGTMLQQCNFVNCGNGVNAASDPITNIVIFGESLGNVVLHCSSNRHQAAAITSVSSVEAVAEVLNSSKTVLIDMNYADIALSDSFRNLCVLSALNNYTYIDYSLKLGVYSRTGRIVISLDDLRRADSTGTQVSFADNYNYSESDSTNLGGVVMTNFEFGVDLQDNSSPTGNETMILRYQNSLDNGITGQISYSISYGV